MVTTFARISCTTKCQRFSRFQFSSSEWANNTLAGKYKARQALNCAFCGVMFQLAEQKDVLRAATASGGDMIEYFVDVDDDEREDGGKRN